jgi:(2Fe-2S) ferredoxin
MRKYDHHFLVCITNRPPALGASCGARGGVELLARLQRALDRARLTEAGMVCATGSTCLGLCEDGPNVVVYPDATWYRGVAASDVPDLVAMHARDGAPVARLVNPDVE